MKVLAIILLSVICSVLSIQEQELLEKMEEFHFQKWIGFRLDMPDLHWKQENVWLFSMTIQREICAHNALFDEGKTTYRKGINKLADWTHEEIKQHYKNGLLNKPATNSGSIFKKSKSVQLPEFVDWREKGAVREVKDQGGCGSCWSFSTNLVDCDKVSLGCGGGWPVDALEYVKQNGIETEEDYPYIENDGVCRTDSSKVVKISGYHQIPEGDEDALTQAVAENGPVSICLFTSNNFNFYVSGILKDSDCPPDQFNHAILIVGCGSENGQDYYIIKNSYGTDWGESGYVKLARNYNNICGLVSRAVIPVL